MRRLRGLSRNECSLGLLETEMEGKGGEHGVGMMADTRLVHFVCVSWLGLDILV